MTPAFWLALLYVVFVSNYALAYSEEEDALLRFAQQLDNFKVYHQDPFSL